MVSGSTHQKPPVVAKPQKDMKKIQKKLGEMGDSTQKQGIVADLGIKQGNQTGSRRPVSVG